MSVPRVFPYQNQLVAIGIVPSSERSVRSVVSGRFRFPRWSGCRTKRETNHRSQWPRALTRQAANQVGHLLATAAADRDTCTVPQDQHGFSRSGRPDLAHAVQPNDR